ncbi:hypothetical protein RND71_037084 [Anisodus tanguticus]|uniref:Plant heme peroxidase family profile domain-containing protein n=1 Tax=Anisodus tanguticus TaxID=243964 RepID=A0AAE1V0Y3_9SOLA|nr:hypothetical protein RND71_037084 [Anisodus tanguticus]
MVPYGRKDGRVCYAKEADLVPMAHEKITDLLEFFQSKELNILDLVVLSGADIVYWAWVLGNLVTFRLILYLDEESIK